MSESPARVAIGHSYGASDTGRKRRRNEDSFVCDPPLFAVADGMGGAQAGELASTLAASALRERTDREPGGEEQIVGLVQEANRRVHQRALDDASASGMGTTMTVALFDEDGSVTIGHVGDSRAYILRDGKLEQLTDDHSLVAELVRRGELSPAEAEVHPQRSVITRALGTEADVDVDAFTVPARPGDLFLLCSDGLTSMVDAAGIVDAVLRNRHDLRGATHALITAANDHGGDDNVTAVLFEIAAADNGVPAVAAAPDEADTLHPEDHVALPLVEETSGAESPPSDEPIDEPNDEQQPSGDGDTVIVAASALYGAPAEAAPATDGRPTTGGEIPEPDELVLIDGHPPAPLWRKLLALLVMALLALTIVVLVSRGLAR